MKHPLNNTVIPTRPCSPDASRGLTSHLTSLRWPLVLVAAALGVALVRPADVASDLLWVIALVIIGMPHGAFDVAVIRDQIRTGGARAAATTAIVYTLLTVVAAICFVLFPSASVVLFLALSAHHFGVSDCVWTRGRAVGSLVDNLVGLSHGVAVLTVPFIVSPVEAWTPFVTIAHAAGGTTSIDPSLTRTAAASLWIFAIMVQIVILVRRRTDARTIEQGGLLLGAALLGLLAPPLFAVGVYFLSVHACGHCLRADARLRQSPSPGLANALRVHWQSAALSIPSAGIVVVIAVTVFGDVRLASVALAFLLFCVVGTLPHHLMWLSTFGPLRSAPARNVV